LHQPMSDFFLISQLKKQRVLPWMKQNPWAAEQVLFRSRVTVRSVDAQLMAMAMRERFSVIIDVCTVYMFGGQR